MLMSTVLKLLFLGDVVGAPGRKAVIGFLPKVKKERELDFIVVNGENSAAGKGITPKIAIDLMRAGATVITTGDHVWDQRELAEFLVDEPRVLRPLNYETSTPGFGSIILETTKGKVGVMQLQGRTFMQPPLENPFLHGPAEAKRMREEEGVKAIFCDFHAEATSEKIAFSRCMDGLASAVVGTHTHVQTADERIFPGGTAHLSDAGMCGPEDSILGREISSVVWRFENTRPTRFPVAKGPVRLCGAFVDIDMETGKALKIERLSELIEEEGADI